MEQRDGEAVVANIHYGGEYEGQLREAQSRGECPLCKQIREDPKIIVEHTLHWYVKRNPYPPYAGEPPHREGDTRPRAAQAFLIIPFQCITDTHQLLPEDWLEVLQLFSQLRGQEGVRGGGLALRFGDPVLSGRTILHLHFHVIVPPPHPEHLDAVLPVWFPIG